MSRGPRTDLDHRPWTGPTRRYDILKEGAIALVVVTALTLGLAALFSSPDEPAVTFQQWATDSPDTLYATTVTELSGSSESGSYGPPYNTAGDGLSIGPLFLQQWAGVTHPYDSAQDLVITPLSSAQQPVAVVAALKAWDTAAPETRAGWATAYDTALNEDAGGDVTQVKPGDYGPVPVLAQGLVDMAASGSYDGVLLAQGQSYATDSTLQLLFLGDGGFLEDKAVAQHLGGDTWGQVNETGSFPGQMWLAPISFWYQLPAFNEEGTTLTDNADAIIFAIMVVVVLVMFLLPFIPGLRSIPRWIPVHRLVWRDWYRAHGRA